MGHGVRRKTLQEALNFTDPEEMSEWVAGCSKTELSEFIRATSPKHWSWSVATAERTSRQLQELKHPNWAFWLTVVTASLAGAEALVQLFLHAQAWLH